MTKTKKQFVWCPVEKKTGSIWLPYFGLTKVTARLNLKMGLVECVTDLKPKDFTIQKFILKPVGENE